MNAEEIRRAIAARGLTQREVAAFAGMDENKLTKSLKGVRAFKIEEMDRIRALLLRDTGDGYARPIPIIGLVAAGNWREAVQRSSTAVPSPDASISPRAFALRVTGDSMDLLVDDGGTVIVDPDDRDLYPKRYYVVINGDGETTFKRFMADPARLVPCSTNDEHAEIRLGGEHMFQVVGRVIWRASRL